MVKKEERKEEKKEEHHKMNMGGAGIVSVVLGILSIINLGGPGIILGIIGFFFGLKQSKAGKNNWSKWGIALNIIGVVGGVIMIFVVVNYLQPYLAQIQQGIPLQ